MGKTVRIGAGQGFYGDALGPAVASAARGSVDYLAFDHLAELTLAILQKDRQRDPSAGYTKDIGGRMRALLPFVAEAGLRITTNAGGLNPRGAVEELRLAAKSLAADGGDIAPLRVGVVTGDDLLPRLDDLLADGVDFANLDTGAPLATIREHVVFANAYLGADPLVDALAAGAQVVLTGRVADPSVFLAPLVYEHGWAHDAWDLLAAGTVVGHLLECSGQATGGNFSGDWWNVDHRGLGFPIAEVAADGTAIVTKAPGTGGRVSFDTLKEQLLYEVHDPGAYLTPDVSADFTSLRMEDVAPDRVALSGMRGAPRPEQLKVVIGYHAGWAGEAVVGFSWPDAIQKARRTVEVLTALLGEAGVRYDRMHTELLGQQSLHGPGAPVPEREPEEVYLRVAIRCPTHAEASQLGRLLVTLGLSGMPAMGGGAGAGRGARELLGVWPTLVPRDRILARVDLVHIP